MKVTICLGLLLLWGQLLLAQSSLELNGQWMVWANYGSGNLLPVGLGTRYIPEVAYQIPFENERKLDFRVAVNMYGSGQVAPFDSLTGHVGLQPYRGWVRYAEKQWEVRAGLQKISFGSASVLRPLMWFDQIDPRDPLKLTNGVWGVLGRFYFLNNANIWLWVLAGNERTKGWEQMQTNPGIPEVGGRIQYPVPKGEIALSYHHRTARINKDPLGGMTNLGEHKIGLDGKWDVTVGFWVESSWTHKSQNIGMLTNQLLLNAGVDYTFGIGNGFNMILEQLMVAYDFQPFAFAEPAYLTGGTLAYPLGLFDQISTVVYIDWANARSYNFVNYQRDLKHLTLYIMAFWNPADGSSIQGNDLVNPLSGKGIQLMLVFNH